ncbi:YrrS family protein [Mesobacillus maritimus]|uniref:YrrS family protein n=1 Tax=Mesobacillus maritimus TaxID=1643336 RepID=UPI00203E07DD|nr:YrrS family protein [Mesobacillus maritimus]MCM3587733.1 YrrS family protein [Mesobacillus maritimus]
MGHEVDNDASRAQKLAKRRKTNLILNGLITIVLVLIVFVTVRIFFSDSQSDQNESETAATVAENTDEQKESTAGTNKENEGKQEQKEENSSSDEEEAEPEPEQEEDGELIVTEGGDSPDVKQTIVDPNWKPVGTTQTGEHAAVYDDSSVDWQEMLKAISYATNIDVNNMTVWRLGNNGSPQHAIGTVSEKGGSTTYRVAIEWVDGEGWKPVKMEELAN